MMLIETRNIEDRKARAQPPDAGEIRSRSWPAARSVRSLFLAQTHREPPSRFRRGLRPERLDLRLASSEIVDAQGCCPWWVSRPSVSSAALRPPVTLTSPAKSLLGSSVDLPSESVRAEPTA